MVMNDMVVTNLLIVCLLIILSAFFVASEFAIVRVRPTRIEQLIAEGNANAVSVKRIINNIDGFLSACQLGITITSLGLGWLGEPTVTKLFHPLLEKLPISDTFAQMLSFLIAFGLVTYINVVAGELFPKSIAIQQTEKVTLLLSKPLIIFYKVMYPFIWILNHAARFVARLYGIKQPTSEAAHSEEELQYILAESYKSGEISISEYRYVHNIFEFDNRLANEIMVPRTEMVTLCEDLTLKEIIKIITVERFTRYPVTKGIDKDSIIGFVHVKQLLTDCIKNRCIEEKPLKNYTQPIIHVMEFIPIQLLLKKMQQDRINMAILNDEFGGTAGIVTVEDILEEIVGEIRDELDVDEYPLIQKIRDNHYILNSKLHITEVNSLLSISLEHEHVHTIGGWVLSKNPDLQKGESIIYDQYEFTIANMNNHQVTQIEAKPLPPV